MRSPLPFPCVPDRPYKILLVQVGTLSFSHPSFGVPVLFIYLCFREQTKKENSVHFSPLPYPRSRHKRSRLSVCRRSSTFVLRLFCMQGSEIKL